MPAKLQSWIFVILLSFLGFCGGMFIGAFFAPGHAGFQSAAVVFWYGVAGLFTGLLTGIIFARRMKEVRLRNALILVFIVSLLLISWIIYRVKKINAQREISANEISLYDDFENSDPLFIRAAFIENDTLVPTGMGMAKPHLSHGKLIYFYHLFPIGMQPYQIRPFDSLLIHKGLNHFEIYYAPAWFFPEVMKLDYDMLLLRTIATSRDWLEVVVNKLTGQTCWISTTDADFTDWTSFLLNVHSVELIDPEASPLRFNSTDDAGIVATTPERFPLQPLAIKGDFMMVSTRGLADRIRPYGWIRWRKNDRLLIRFSMLS